MSKLIDAIHKNLPLDEINKLINKKSIDETNDRDFTPLMVAVYNQKIDIAELLLKRGANPWYINYAGYSAFMLWVNAFIEMEYWDDMENMFYLMCKYYIYKNEYAPRNLFKLILHHGWPAASRHFGGSLFDEDKNVAL